MAINKSLVNGLGGPAGFGEQTLAFDDDNSSPAIDLTGVFGPQGLKFPGASYTQVYVNNNGNLTFTGPQGSASGTIGAIFPQVAPFWSDVDTRGRTGLAATPGGNSTGSNSVYWDLDTVNDVFTVTWDDVRGYDLPVNLLNAFQVQVVRVSGGFDFIYRYESINWALNRASAGVAVADGQFVSLPDNPDALLALETTPGNTGIAGVYQFGVRTGGNGNDTLNGTDGDDFIDGGAGHDALNGGLGNDTLQGGAGTDALNGGSGIDTASYSNASARVKVSLAVTGAQNTLGAGNDTLTGIENLTGSAHNDVLTGNALGNTLEGRAGDDTLSGGGGVDTAIYAGAVSGVTVNLALTGAQNTGGAGIDTLSGVENLVGSASHDALTGNAASNTLEGGAGNDTMSGGDGIDTASYVSAVAGVTVILSLGSITVNTVGAGTDTLSNIENIAGSAFNDTLTGNGLSNTLEGRAGNDSLNGGGGIDTASYASATAGVTVSLTTLAQNTGGAGTDTLSNMENLAGGAFNDVLTGNASSNTLEGRGGKDTLNGGDGVDTASYASAAAGVTVSLVLAGAQNTAGAGIDTLSSIENLAGGRFNDTLTGNASNNTLEGRAGNDTLKGGGGIDTASYAEATAGVKVNLVVTGAQNTVGAGSDTLSGFENLTGSSFNDALTGNASNNILEGGAGNDTLKGGGGIDTASYANATAAVTVSLALAGPQDTGGAGTDTLISIENLTGSAFDDVLTGNASNNVLDGGNGDDAMSGGGGNDTYIVSGNDDVMVENSGGGNDTCVITISLNYSLTDEGLEFMENITFTAAAGGVGGFGNDRNNIATLNDSSNYFEGLDGADRLDGRGASDQLYGGMGDDFVSGGSGNDDMWGGGSDTGPDSADGDDGPNGGTGADKMWGGNGNDIYYVDTQGDLVFEEAPVGPFLLTDEREPLGAIGDIADTVRAAVSYSLDYAQAAGVEDLTLIAGKAAALNATGNALANVLTGNGFANRLSGLGGDDTLAGGNGNDNLNGGDGVDTASYASAARGVTVNLAASNAQDTVGAGRDTLTFVENLSGSGLGDTLAGNAGANTLSGGNGNDILVGRDGNDRLVGGAGNDVLRGLAGADVLAGGSGADRFDFDSVSDSPAGESTQDTISDFKRGQDKIDLSTIDANGSASGNTAFSFTTANAFTARGQLRFDAVQGLLLGNTDADFTDAEFSILLPTLASMGAGDFVL